MTAREYAREDLIEICERSFTPESNWHNRDSAEALRQLGECYALLRAGCDFTISRRDLVTDDQTIWVEVTCKGFAHFDYDGGMDRNTYYLPTPSRLESAGPRKDWY